jgi:Zinc finger, ZZ type
LDNVAGINEATPHSFATEFILLLILFCIETMTEPTTTSSSSSSSSSSLGSSSSSLSAVAPVVRHRGVTCDECGLYPIVGTRFTATHLFDYDICSTCLADHHHDQEERDLFVAFHRDMNRTAGGRAMVMAVSRTSDNNRIVAFSVEVATRKLERNETSIPLACLFLGQQQRFQHPTTNDNNEEHNNNTQRFCQAIASNNQLQILRIHMQFNNHARHTVDWTRTIVAIAQGLAVNSSIEQVFWNMSPEYCTLETASAIRDMMATNTSIQALFLGFGAGWDEPSEDQGVEADEFACILWQGLRSKNTALQHLRLNGCRPLSSTTMDALLDVLVSTTKSNNNSTLQKVNVEVEHDMDRSRLELALACHRDQWLKRFANTQATRMDLLEILVEALEKIPDHPVAVAYQLLRSRPDVITAFHR